MGGVGKVSICVYIYIYIQIYGYKVKLYIYVIYQVYKAAQNSGPMVMTGMHGRGCEVFRCSGFWCNRWPLCGSW